MPRFVRPSFVKVYIDGEEKCSTGPRSRDGDMRIEVYARSEDTPLHVATISLGADKKTVIVQLLDHIGKITRAYTLNQ